jgi:hypothetical protein
MKKTIISAAVVLSSLSVFGQGEETVLEKPTVKCASETGILTIESTALNPNIDDSLISKEARVCFKSKKAFKMALAEVMKEINPKDNFYQCNTEKDPAVLILKTWESGRPGIVADGNTEDPMMEMINERSLLVRSPISCYAKGSTGLFSGIQGGVNMTLDITDNNQFRMNSDKDQSRLVTVKLVKISK